MPDKVLISNQSFFQLSKKDEELNAKLKILIFMACFDKIF